MPRNLVPNLRKVLPGELENVPRLSIERGRSRLNLLSVPTLPLIRLHRRDRAMTWIAILLLLLAGIYVSVERGQSPMDKFLRWMVVVGALLMALLLGTGVLL